MDEIIAPLRPMREVKVQPDTPVSREVLLERIDVEGLVIRGNRFLAPTRSGGSVSITLTRNCEKLVIRRIRPSDRSQPSAYVGRAPLKEFLELLRDMLALKKNPSC